MFPSSPEAVQERSIENDVGLKAERLVMADGRVVSGLVMADGGVVSGDETLITKFTILERSDQFGDVSFVRITK
jgi:hypothetical protein